TGDHVAVDAAGDLVGRHQAGAADALDGDIDDIVELDHAVHGVGPADDLGAEAGQVLGGGGQPHAVHQGRVETDELGGVGGGVDRVVVTGNHGERGHVGRGGDGGGTHEGTWGVLDDLVASTVGLGRLCHVGGGDAATDGEAGDQLGHHLTLGGQGQTHGDDAARGGLLDGGTAGFNVDGAAVGKLLQWDAQVQEVVEVDGVEQTLDDGVTVGKLAGAQ